MEAPKTKVITTAGRPGDPAVDDLNWENRNPEANTGCVGQDGRSATNPTNGSPGSDIRVRLAYSADDPAIVQIKGEGGHTGMSWKVVKDERMLLNTKGGDGGAGGRGENGQAGGRGRNGRNATKYHNGEDGQDGAPGGNGGAGTNGGDGAGAGDVFVTVDDNDTDLLISLIFDVRGGVGGISGQHGEPGDGGQGGRGGMSYAWSDDKGYSYSRPGGRNGSNGSPGIRPSTYLSGGKSGANGSVQIKIIRGDLTEATYPGIYSLQVVGFDIIDENQDSINEPGEHILVHNIRVQNVGGMPSPSARTIQLLIQETAWLNPVAAEPLWLPQEIQPGQQVDIPGTLRAYVRNCVETPEMGKLEVPEEVRITAVFNERMQRALPDFCGASHIMIAYPLVLSPPMYLDCVAKGDRVRFKWVLHNNSTKSYGIDGILKRATATKLKDPLRFFNLTYATGDKPDEAIDEIPDLEANSMVEIEQDFAVAPKTMEFTNGSLTLELALSDPLTGAMRCVQTHQMQMQISGVYSLSANPAYLLIVNAKTPNYAIHQIIMLVRSRLQTHLDIFNVSLTGSLVSPVTNENVVKSYVGRNVIVFGNKFTWFGLGQSGGGAANGSTQQPVSVNPWDLLDPKETGVFCTGGTSILFANVEDMQSLNVWAAQGTFPEHDFSATADCITGEHGAEVIDSLRQTAHGDLPAKTQTYRFSVKKGIFRTLDSQANAAAKSAAKQLNKKIPLRRFVVVSDGSKINQEAGTGSVVICEGIPKTATLLASSAGFAPLTNPPTLNISDYNMFLIVSILPFAVRARMFWNVVGRAETRGLPCAALYQGLEGWWNQDESNIDDKILQALSLSLQSDMSTEIYRFCAARPRFPDPLTIPEKMTQLHLVSKFFAMAPIIATGQVTNTAQAQLLTQTLGAVHAISNSLSFWQLVKSAFRFLGNRKARVSPKLNEAVQASIVTTCSPDVVAAIKEHVEQRSKQIKDVIVGAKATIGHKNFTGVLHKELAELAQVTQISLYDLTELNPLSISLNAQSLKVVQDQFQLHRQNQENLSNYAKRVLHTHLNPVDNA
ncbi:Fc.00g073100.m01.CDS01 [Cosmosporella sp. VM-42]